VFIYTYIFAVHSSQLTSYYVTQTPKTSDYVSALIMPPFRLENTNLALFRFLKN